MCRIIADSNTSDLRVDNYAITDFFRILIVPTLLESTSNLQ
jgi:hypothetical protein